MTNYDLIYEMVCGKFNFGKDLLSNNAHEDWILKYIINKKLAETVTKVDPTDKEKRKLYDMVLDKPNHLVEVKRDLKCFETDNVFIEISCNDIPSGITTTKADWWLHSYYCCNGMFKIGIAETNDVKNILSEGRLVSFAGDKGKAKGYIIKWSIFNNICFYKDDIDVLDYITQIGLRNEYDKRIKNIKPSPAAKKQNLTW